MAPVRNRLSWCLLLLLAGCGGGTTDPTPPPPAPPPAPPPPPPPPSPIEVVLDRAPLPQSGGTVKVVKAGSPLNGLSIDVPSGGFSGATQWTVSEVKDVHPTLPAKLRQLGSTILVQNDQGFAAQPFTLAIPVRVGADSAVAAFFRDPDTGTLELIPIVARTDTSIVLLTSHVAADQMLIPSGASPAPADGFANATTPGRVQIILVGGLAIDLRIRINTTFQPGVDDWEFSNRGSFAAAGGFCEGSVLSAIYHNYARKAAKGSLFGLYDDLPTLEDDNPQGIRLASAIQRLTVSTVTAAVNGEKAKEAAIRVGQPFGGAWWTKLQMQALAIGMLVTGRGQNLAINNDAEDAGHALVAYAFEWGLVFVADPNDPGIARQIQFNEFTFFPFSFSTMRGLPSQNYTKVFVLGVSALLPVRTLDGLFAQLDAKTVGSNYFAPPVLEYRDPADTVWRVAKDTVVTASTGLTFRTLCLACPFTKPNRILPHRGLTIAYDEQGGVIGNDQPPDADGVDVPVVMGIHKFGMTSQTMSGDHPNDEEFYYNTFKWLDLKRVDFSVAMSPANPQPGTPVVFTVTNGGIGDNTARYRWLVGTDPEAFTAFGVRTLTRTLASPNGTEVVVELLDAKGDKLARATLTVGAVSWQLTSISDPDEFIYEPDDDSDADGDPQDVGGTGDFPDMFRKVLFAPGAGLIEAQKLSSNGDQLVFRVLRSGIWNPSQCCSAPGGAEIVQVMGVRPEVQRPAGPYFGSWNRDFFQESTVDPTAGTMTSQWLGAFRSFVIVGGGTQTGPEGGIRFSATRNGDVMTGTISVGIVWTNDLTGKVDDPIGVYRFPFTARRVR